jgi:4-alpha-glucanotransferase
MFERSSGILLPIFSLPSKYGIGTFGKEAYKFIDFLRSAGQRYWQLLPLGHTSFGDSPYSCFSVFAGNPYFIDLETLAEEGFINQTELKYIDFGIDYAYIDYRRLFDTRYEVLRKDLMRFFELKLSE